MVLRIKFVQFNRQNNSMLLKTERGFILINLNKVKFVQSSDNFPYQQKMLLVKSFIALGGFSTTINVLKLLFISDYFAVDPLAPYFVPFIVVQLCATAFILLGIRWLKQCRKHRKDFPHHSRAVKLVFEDASVKTITVSDPINISLMISWLSKEKEVC